MVLSWFCCCGRRTGLAQGASVQQSSSRHCGPATGPQAEPLLAPCPPSSSLQVPGGRLLPHVLCRPVGKQFCPLRRLAAAVGEDVSGPVPRGA